VAIRLSENFVYDVLAHFFVHDVLALNRYALGHVPDSAKGIDPDIFRPNHSRDIGMIAETLSYLYKMRDFSK
jgi:hypothetical protein